jgi:hypothetical protein
MVLLKPWELGGRGQPIETVESQQRTIIARLQEERDRVAGQYSNEVEQHRLTLSELEDVTDCFHAKVVYVEKLQEELRQANMEIDWLRNNKGRCEIHEE